jgi:hypothetical protein
MAIQSWKSDRLYSPGDIVSHDGRKWVSTSSNRNNPPDDVPGDWQDVSNASNLEEFIAIKESFDSYEVRVAQRQQQHAQVKQSALDKLHKLGITTEELEALLN